MRRDAATVRIRRAAALGFLALLGVATWQLVAAFAGNDSAEGASPETTPKKADTRTTAAAPAAQPVGAINPKVPGITTFRGNLTRSYYGEGPVPRTKPKILWRYPRTGGLCSQSADETGLHTWCGVGWTGQPNVISRKRGKVLELRFGAYDADYHFLNARTGRQLRPDLDTGDLAKGSATSDPDGYPLYYAGSRDNLFRIVALDRGRPQVLWSMDSNTSVPYIVWNNDWDGAALIVGDYLLEGGENSWFYVVKLNRGWTRKGKVRVRPEIKLTVPSWDPGLEAVAPDRHFSIENSVAFRNGVAYFANSAGLVQGWNISKILKGGSGARRVFRFWTGDDTDASIVIDDEGYLYVASELEKFNARSLQVGQLIKLDPRRNKPLIWRVHLRQTNAGAGGSWSTPAIDRGVVYVATNYGGVVAVDQKTGRVLWKIRLPGPTWSSPVVVDGVLLEGDCAGNLNAYDVTNPRRKPRRLWRLQLGGCIESTPAVWKGRIYLGTRGGAMYAIGLKQR